MQIINYLIFVVIGFAVGVITSFIIMNDGSECREKLETAQKDAKLKDSLYRNCNGKIARLNRDFMYESYIQNNNK